MCYDTKSVFFQVYFFFFLHPRQKGTDMSFLHHVQKETYKIMIKRSPFHIQKRITAHEKIMLIQHYCYV